VLSETTHALISRTVRGPVHWGLTSVLVVMWVSLYLRVEFFRSHFWITLLCALSCALVVGAAEALAALRASRGTTASKELRTNSAMQ
jgi:cell division protein FtsW (lipid II flippase)